MNLFAKKKTETTRLISIITSYAATAAVVRVYDRPESVTHPIVLFSHVEPIAPQHGGNAGLIAEYACAALRRSIESCRAFHAADENTDGTFDELVCAIGEPWITTMARTAHSDRNDSFKVTQKIINELAARDRKAFEQEINRDYADRDIGLVQAARPIIDINGYRVRDAINQQATSLDAHIAYSIADANFLDEVSGVFVDVFHRHDITFKSMDIARGAIVPYSAHAITIDIGGVTTTLSIIDRGVPTHHISIPTGLADLENHISKLFAVPRNRVASVMNFATDEKLLQHERDEYYRRIELAYKPMGILIERACVELRRQLGMIPDTGYLIAVPEWIHIIRPLLERSADLKIIDDNLRQQGIVYAHGAQGNSDLELAILGVIDK